MRALKVTAETAPAMAMLRDKGVNFTNPHSLFPTFTTANASGFATGHYLGDTGDFSNTIYAGYPVYIPDAPPTVTPFLENDIVLGDVDEHFQGDYLDEETMVLRAVVLPVAQTIPIHAPMAHWALALLRAAPATAMSLMANVSRLAFPGTREIQIPVNVMNVPAPRSAGAPAAIGAKFVSMANVAARAIAKRAGGVRVRTAICAVPKIHNVRSIRAVSGIA